MTVEWLDTPAAPEPAPPPPSPSPPHGGARRYLAWLPGVGLLASAGLAVPASYLAIYHLHGGSGFPSFGSNAWGDIVDEGSGSAVRGGWLGPDLGPLYVVAAAGWILAAAALLLPGRLGWVRTLGLASACFLAGVIANQVVDLRLTLRTANADTDAFGGQVSVGPALWLAGAAVVVALVSTVATFRTGEPARRVSRAGVEGQPWAE